LNLKIVPAGIRDFGADQGYTPLDLVMVALDCDLESAWQFLSKRLDFVDDPVIELKAPAEAATAKPAETAAAPAADPLLAYTQCPGVVGDIVDFIVATALER
jgi:hypothetical protein